MQRLLEKIREILRNRRIRMFFTRFVSLVAAIVVFITTYALVLPAITLEKTASCGIDEHQHDDSCYEYVLTCGLEESEGHHHDDSCYTVTEELECQMEEHQHSQENGCYDEEGNLICQLAEHAHDDSCYSEKKTLTCDQQESEGHQHTDACYEKVLVCDKEVHIHSAECYKDEENAEESKEEAADQSSSVSASEDSAGETETEAASGETLPDTYVPELDPLNMEAALSKNTGFYYFHAEEGQEVPDNSTEITDWQEVKEDTELAPTDLVKMYLPYTIPAGSLNGTNPTARYRLPENIHLTDDQIKAINKNGNGITAGYAESDPEYQMYLGIEAIEGDRTPDELLQEGVQEYISAVVRAENVYEDDVYKDDKYLGQDLIFTFVPYSIEKNQIVYDEENNPVSAGEKITGWFACDFRLDQIDWIEEEVQEETGQDFDSDTDSDSAADADSYSDPDSDADPDLDADPDADSYPDPDSENVSDAEVSDSENVSDGASDNDSSDKNTADTSVIAVEKTADILFVSEDKERDIQEIRRTLKLIEQKEISVSEDTEEADTQEETPEEKSEETPEEIPEEAEEYRSGSLTADGDGYRITLDYTEEAKIPENAVLSVREITAETDKEAYEACLEQAQQHVDEAGEAKSTVDSNASRFFDIEIQVSDEDGATQKIEPAAPVSVNIQIADAPAASADKADSESGSGSGEAQHSDPTVLHFAEDGVEQIDSKTSVGETEAEKRDADSGPASDTDDAENIAANDDSGKDPGDTFENAETTQIRFEAEAFSIYGVVYTVDFHWEADGNTFEFSIPGSSSILLSKVIEALKLPFEIKDVRSVSFSDDTLLRVTKVEEETTAEEFLNRMDDSGVQTWMAEDVVTHEEGKDDEAILLEAAEIKQMDTETVLNTGEWILTALSAFHTDEELKISLNNGKEYLIKVTDLDTNTNGQKPALVDDTVNTIAEGIKITMFDYGPEKLDNVNNTYNSVDNSGINKGHSLKFYSYGTNGNTMNNFTGGAYAMQGIVRSTLDDNGYPVVNSGESLQYLFDPNMPANGKTVTSANANYLFRRTADRGMELFYDSDINYAYLDGDNFKVYSDTYLEEGADYENPFRIGFYPYNDYDNRYHCIHGNNFNWGCKGSKDWRVRDQVGHYNHHFGMTVEGNFYMTDDKKMTNIDTGAKEDMVFRFSGDDDLWVFIDGVLVLDIGGIHNPVDGEINFTTGQVTVSAAKTANGGSQYALGTNTTIANAFAKVGKTWDDSPLSHHDIKVFYMERGGMYSNLAVTMNLPTFPHTKEVTLHKKSKTSHANLAGATFKLYSDVACTKEIKDKETGEAITVVSSSDTDTLGEVHISNLIPGQTYYFKETTAPGGHKLFDGIFMITVPANDLDPAVVYLTEDGQPTGDPIENIINEEDKYGEFDFFKVELGTDAKLQGAEFTLYTDQDCQTIAKDRNKNNLVKQSGTDGKIHFEGIPAGTTYYMKETKEPDEYFPSSEVYRVVVSEDGETTSVYKVNETTPLFTNKSVDTDRKVENKPKAEKTSISVEKLWEDGASNHSSDTVTVQLYDDVVDGPKTGGKLTLTVKADKWYDSVNPNTEVNAPTSGSITYTVQKNDGSGWSDLYIGQELNNGNSWQKTYPDLPVKKDGTDIQYRVVSVTGDGTKVVTSAIYEPSNGVVSGESGTICLSGNVVTQTGPASVASVSVTAVTGINGDDWQITLSNFRIWYYNGYNYEQKGFYKEGSVTLNVSNQQLSIELPEHIYVNGEEVSKSQVRYGFMLQTSSINGNSVYMRTTPAHYTWQGQQSVFYGSNGEFQIPADSQEIKIEFSGQPLTTSFSPYFHLQSAPKRAVLSDSSIVEKGDSYTVQGTSQTVGSAVVLNNGTNGWTYTWSDLVQSETVTEDDYTFTRTHNYYVKEISVNLADGTEEDFVESTYSFIWNDDNDHAKGIKKVIISNRVPEKMSLTVTKKWQDALGNAYIPEDSQKEIWFDLYQVVEGGAPEGSVYRAYDTLTPVRYENGIWTTVTIDNLREEIKEGSEIKKVSYYVKEVLPQVSEDLSVFYRTSDGRVYSDPADSASNSDDSFTIVNVNSERKISITKKWYYKNGSSLQEVDEPEVKEIFFKLKKVNKTTGADEGFYTAQTDEMPESSAIDQAVVSMNSSSDGTVFRIACVGTSEEVTNEYGSGTHTETVWTWNTLTFRKLPTDVKYYMVETDGSGKPLVHDTANGSLEISYVDANGKEITQTSPIDPSIPGDYTIKNIEKRASLYAEKIWNAANKDNLAGNEPIWFSLMRIQTDGNGNYDINTLEETPGIGRFNLRESGGWTRYFPNIQIAPTGQTDESQYKYYQYFAVELGLLKSAFSVPDVEKQYELIDDMFIKYQSKGGGTGNSADGSDARIYAAYGEGVDPMNGLTTQPATVQQWINANKGSVVSWLTENADKIRVRTWGSQYDGTGTLGIFNSSNEYVEEPIHIIKEWKKANGDPLDPDKLSIINAEASDTMDKYTVEIQLMQRAKNLKKNDVVVFPGPYDSKYGSTVLFAKDEVIMQSDLFQVEKEGEGAANYWKYRIPATYTNADGISVNQLPSKGPFVLDGETYQAEFEYYLSEFRVYNGSGEDRTPHWTAACLIDTDTYTLTLENYETTDLTVHKTWEEVPAENRNYVDENVKAVLYKVFRIPDGESDESKKEDITEQIGANYEAYDLTAANIYETSRTVKVVGEEEIEIDPATEPEEGEVRKTYYEDYIRIDQPDGSWWNGSSAKDTALKINNLDAHIRDYVTKGSKDDWKKYKYWIVEQEYIDGVGIEHPVSELLHGNTAAYPKYQSSTAGTGLNTPNFGNEKTTICPKIEIGSADKAHLGAINTVRGITIHLLKDDETDSTRKLSGAKFILLKKGANNRFDLFNYAANVDGTALTVNINDVNGQFEITDAEKGVMITGLMPGIYELQEKKAPEGYIIAGPTMQFEVKSDGTLAKLPPTGQTVPEGQTDKDPRYKLDDISADGQKKSEMIVHNPPGAALPNTGGPGTRLFTILGSILILGAGVLLWRRRRLI